MYFYPRSPCGERQKSEKWNLDLQTFLSTLSLRRATLAARWVLLTLIFLSTLSLRRATNFPSSATVTINISIHALLAESDEQYENQRSDDLIFLSTLSLRRATGRAPSPPRREFYFYPRSPCGERQFRKLLYPGSTRISIHALLAESDNGFKHK